MRGKPSIEERAAALLNEVNTAPQEPDVDPRVRQALRGMVDALTDGAARLPGILADLGITDPIVLNAAPEAFVTLVVQFADKFIDLAIDFDVDDLKPIPKWDLGRIAKKHGFKYNRRTLEADTMSQLEKLDEVVWFR
jgi:hypothetical protein